VAHFERINAIDSHTGGEPTRVILDGGPDLGNGSVAERAKRFAETGQRFREVAIQEPRGSDILVGALLVPPSDPDCGAGVIFFNNAGVLGMCGHGTIGLAVTLAHLGEIQPGDLRIETPVGIVTATLHDEHRVTVRNVPSYRFAKGVSVDVPGMGRVSGDIAYGGNWFFLSHLPSESLERSRVEHLTNLTWRIRQALETNGIAGRNGAAVDHIELTSPPFDPRNHARNFVLCPGKAYDRSPCGTGTSAKLACLAADGKLKAGEAWRQESITGSVFEATYEDGDDGKVIPSITGAAFITAETTLLIDESERLYDRSAR
jgi:4-hydroxyproline epimerase